jgi:osmotically-inducible protein OsmY
MAAPVIATFAAILFVVTAPTSVSAAPTLAMTDSSIGETVEDQLFIDQAVPAQRIEVVAEDGIVTLTGTVSNILAKERAAKIAETVRGVRAVVNNITVRPAAARKPIEIERDILSALADDSATDAWQIVPKVAKDGAVTLTGTVESWPEKELAETVVKGVRGVTEVNNNIDVHVDELRSDQDIKADIQRTLRWDTLVDHALIGVAVDDGKVRLSGTVGSAAEWNRARREAWTAGVKSVDASKLVVAKWTRDPALRENKYVLLTEDEIANALDRALDLDPRVDAENVDTSVMADVVILRGTVDSLRSKRVAGQDARNTVGVFDVVNRIRVAPKAQITDAVLADKVGNALRRDPYVERFEIIVTVIDGTAYLSGMVDSYFEKARADLAAGSIKGVVAVVNNLDVRRIDKPYAYDPYLGDPYVYDFDWYTYQPLMTFKSDAKIKKDIEGELWWSPFVDSDEIKVTVKNGVATLEGTVQTWSEFSAARENAFEGGATWVINDLSVTGGGKES